MAVLFIIRQVTDDMGTIRIFNYPCTSGSGYTRIYTDHMMYIN